MNRYRLTTCVGLFSAVLGLASTAFAQATVSASGSSTVERPADTMRLEIELAAEGNDAEDALDMLAEIQASAAGKLKRLAADNVIFGPPQLPASEGGLASLMAAAMAAEKGGRRGGGGAAVRVTLTLTAEWPLESGDGAALALAAQRLQTKVAAADLADLAAHPELAEASAEGAAGAAIFSQMFGGGGETPGTPNYTFVATISDADRQQALTEAVNQSRDEAALLARAAGRELGNLVSLTASRQSGGGLDMQNLMQASMQMASQMAGGGSGASAAGGAGEPPNEISGDQPASVSATFQVTATYDLK